MALAERKKQEMLSGEVKNMVLMLDNPMRTGGTIPTLNLANPIRGGTVTKRTIDEFLRETEKTYPGMYNISDLRRKINTAVKEHERARLSSSAGRTKVTVEKFESAGARAAGKIVPVKKPTTQPTVKQKTPSRKAPGREKQKKRYPSSNRFAEQRAKGGLTSEEQFGMGRSFSTLTLAQVKMADDMVERYAFSLKRTKNGYSIPGIGEFKSNELDNVVSKISDQIMKKLGKEDAHSAYRQFFEIYARIALERQMKIQ